MTVGFCPCLWFTTAGTAIEVSVTGCCSGLVTLRSGAGAEGRAYSVCACFTWPISLAEASLSCGVIECSRKI